MGNLNRMVNFRAFLRDCKLFKEILAEFFGTFILVSFTVGAAAQRSFHDDLPFNYISSTFCGGVAVMMAVYVAGNVSGAHVNPAVTFAMASIGKFKWYKVPYYMLSQYFGALVGGSFVYVAYNDAIEYHHGNNRTLEFASVWTSFPSKYLTIENAFFDSMAAACLLMILNLSVTDMENMGVESGQQPLILGLVVTTIGFGFSTNAGNPMNPAKDFGTRAFLALVEHSDYVFTGATFCWWWIPLVAPHLGTLCGGLLYEVLIQPNKHQEITTSRTCQPRIILQKDFETSEEEALMPSKFSK